MLYIALIELLRNLGLPIEENHRISDASLIKVEHLHLNKPVRYK